MPQLTPFKLQRFYFAPWVASAKALGFLLLAVNSLSLFAAPPSLTRQQPFSKNSLIHNSQSVPSLNTQGLSMSQSYSTSFGMGGGGQYSYGLYMNHLSYQLLPPLTLTLDLGFFSPFHSSGSSFGKQQGSTPYGSLVSPRFGLVYQPNNKLTLAFQYTHMRPGMVPLGQSWPY